MALPALLKLKNVVLNNVYTTTSVTPAYHVWRRELHTAVKVAGKNIIVTTAIVRITVLSFRVASATSFDASATFLDSLAMCLDSSAIPFDSSVSYTDIKVVADADRTIS